MATIRPCSSFLTSRTKMTFRRGRHLHRVTQHIATAPHGLDVVFAAGRQGELFAQLADENVDDLELGLVNPAIEVVEEHLLGYGGALAHAEQLKNGVFLTRQAQWPIVD